MGNICRSPSAEGVFRKLLEGKGLTDRFVIDSAGTHDYHVGAPPDRRAQKAARRRGVEIGALRARQVEAADFERFDWIVAMDVPNLVQLERLQPHGSRARLGLLLDYTGSRSLREVPDPYTGDAAGFERVLDLVEEGARGLLATILAQPQPETKTGPEGPV